MFPFIKNNKKSQNRKVAQPTRLYRMSRSILDWVQLWVRVAVVVLLVMGAYQVFFHSDKFVLRTVTLSGDFKHVTHDDVLRLSEIDTSKSIFAMNLYAMQRQILRHPWIASVELRRILPGAISIRIYEHEPLAVLVTTKKMPSADGKFVSKNNFYLMNKTGKLFRKVNEDDVKDLPVIKGFNEEDLIAYPHYYGKHVASVENFFDFISQKFSETNLIIRSASYDVVKGVTLYVLTIPEQTEMELYFGHRDLELKVDYWDRFYLTMRSEGRWYQHVDLHTADKIYARL